MQHHLLEVSLVDGLFQTVCVHHLRQHFAPDVGRASVVVAGHHASACCVEAGREDVDGGAQAGVGFFRANAHVLSQRLAEGVVGLVQHRCPTAPVAQLLEALVGGQLAFLFRLVEVVEVGGVGIDASGRERIAGRAKQFVDGGLLLALALEDDLLRIGDDDVESRTIQGIERRARLFEVVKAQVRR